MPTYEKYNLILCLIVFIALTALFSTLITIIVRYGLKAINAGLDDEKLTKEYLKQKNKKKNRLVVIFSSALPILVCAILACALCFSLYSRFTQNSKVGKLPTLKVVETGSMETKHKENTYLFENNLNDQIKTFDLIVLHQLPKEEDLKLYDIVVYEINGHFIVHRIVGIEEPNERHPNERWFVLRGDANKVADDFPVTYKQMRSIYRGKSIPFVGTFVVFMQSPSGMLCFLLVVFAVVTLPIVERKYKKAITARLGVLGLLPDSREEVAATAYNEVSEVFAEAQVSRYTAFGKRKMFAEKLPTLSSETIAWYERLVYVLQQLPNIKRTQAKYHELYRQGNAAVAKITIRGKSLYVYLAVNANDYQGVQYGFKDVSQVKAHGKLICECKITSNRKLKNVLKIIASYGENIKIDLPSENFYRLRKKLTLKQKLAKLPQDRKTRFKQLVALMDQAAQINKRESKSCLTYKQGRKPLLKLTVKGKSVYAYLAVNPADYTAVKYGIKDVSQVKAYRDYPAQCKITSDRKLKYLKQIIQNQL